jgi:hypothetical protein
MVRQLADQIERLAIAFGAGTNVDDGAAPSAPLDGGPG